MLALIIRHSLLGMFLSAVLGFILPSWSAAVFPFLPYVLFTLMMLTLLGMPLTDLLTCMRRSLVWWYGGLHALVTMALLLLVAWMGDLGDELTLALLAVGATGSLFATPAIVRALGLDSLMAMAMTIATTLLLPAVILVPISIYGTGESSLNWGGYFMRLGIFIGGPLLISYCVRRFLPKSKVDPLLVKISPYTILLVFAFPFGLIGDFRGLWDYDEVLALGYLLLALVTVALFFAVAFFSYRRHGHELALMAAITSGNRNVLLTYTIAGALLGPAFLPLAGALQLPTYFLPVFTRWLHRRLLKKS
ncbi:hypothetical protein FJM67_03890 [Maribrevibacterium harenarium]|uniref:BASS family bile acid:Na+ symporter n=1 Tax=Maribrevibacterium harenarium TaxID=2589817 RepID=A0A501X2Y7_9GAMM|nr:hypothetical protein [Maribrevibacterium harenarium]TPE54777.1 hypothetical protein FJM67_03890 [Maribrevibacterium harenarium]